MESEPVRAGRDAPQRIEAARRVLAEAPGEAIDRLAALSARLLGAAHAQVSVFTDEQVELTARAPLRPSADTLCEWTFAHGEGTPELRADGIGAYLGVPIDVAGVRVGVLGVYDAEPFDWTAPDLEVLRELAETVSAVLERGALAAELETSTVRLDLGFAAAAIGSFDWDLVTNALYWDERLMDLFGYTPETYTPHIDSFSDRVHPDDRHSVAAAIARAVERRGDYEADYRVVRPDGSIRWIAARGRVLADADGIPLRMIGAAYDTTAVHSAAERLGRVLETMSTAFLTLDRRWRITYVNGAAERIFGRRETLVGQPLRDVAPELQDAVKTGRAEHYRPELDAWLEVRASWSEEGFSLSFHDVTDRIRAEHEAAEATSRLQILSGASGRLAGTLEVEELFRILADVVLSGFGSGVAVALSERIIKDLDGRESATAGTGFRVAHVAPAWERTGDEERSESAVRRSLAEQLGGAPRGLAALRGAAVPETAMATGARPASELAPAFAEALGDVPVLTLPLVSRGRRLGALIVVEPVEGADDQRVLTELAARAGVALDNAVLFGAERRLALTLQRSLLPAGVPQLPGIELGTRYLPGTGGRDVGGDFYIAHPFEDGRVLLVIGDVMGHGAQAAARMGQLRSVLAAYAYEGDPPDLVLAHLSMRAPALLDLPLATVLVGIYDPPARTLAFAMAGHLPPLIAPKDGPPAFVEAKPGPPLGAGASEYELHTADVPPGATVVLYTDGLVEERSRAIDQGLEALRSALVGVDLPPDELCAHVLQAVGRAQGGEDDIALLVMRA